MKNERELRWLTQWVAQELGEYIEGDPLDEPCSCSIEECSNQNPQCWTRRLHVLRLELLQASETKIETLHPTRLRNLPERIFVEQWIDENTRQVWLNRGFTLAEWILNPTGREYPDPVTDHDMRVMTTLVQWLGTSVGRGFIERCERKVREAQEGESHWNRDLYPRRLNDGPHSLPTGHPYNDIPSAIASRWVDPGSSPFWKLREEIFDAMRWAVKNQDQLPLFETPTEERMIRYLTLQGWTRVERGEIDYWIQPGDEDDFRRHHRTGDAFELATMGQIRRAS